MPIQPTCPKCGERMDRGFIVDRGHGNLKQATIWVAGDAEPSFWTGLKTGDRDKFAIRTFRCSECGFLESYAKGLNLDGSSQEKA